MIKGNIHILVGLPGSGKTFFAKEMAKKKSYTYIIDCDKLEQIYHKDFIKKIMNEIDNKVFGIYSNNNIILDGLFLTNETIINVINSIGKNKKQFNFIIHYWNEDRDICLKNDNGRRTENSTTVIKKAVFEKLNTSEIKNKTSISNIKIEKHKVFLKPNWAFFADKYIKTEELHSSLWIVNIKKTNSQYSGYSYIIEEKQPSDFKELDELLEIIYPNITYLQYKKMFRECVSIKTTSDYEYYIGEIEKSYYVCNIEKLYNFLSNYIII